MYASQIIFITIILFIIYKTIRSYQKKLITKYFLLIWLSFWSLIMFILFDQNVIAEMASILGIGRGVDLAVYSSIIVLFYLIYILLIKIQELEKKITILVRRDALKNDHKFSK